MAASSYAFIVMARLNHSTILLLGLVLATVVTGCRLPGQSAKPEATRPLTYVAIGASDSVGVGANIPESEGWVPVLHAHLPSGSRLVNLGVSGTLLKQAVEQQLPVALDSDPDLVTVWLAVNDLNARVPLERYSAELNTLLGALRERTNAVILVGNVPDVSRVPVYQQVDRELMAREVARWNASIADAAAKNGAVLVDLHARWQELSEHPEYIGRDGFHPSADGYRRLAEVFLDTLAGRTDIL